MEELGKQFPILLPFLVLGVPAIVYLFRGWMSEKDGRLKDIVDLTKDFQATLDAERNSNKANIDRLVQGLDSVKSIADNTYQLVVSEKRKR